MFSLPTPPPFEGMHPLVVHLPIGVLVIVPLFILLAIVFKQNAKNFTLTAAILSWIGTIGAIVAVITGQAAITMVMDHSPELNAVMQDHVALALMTRNLFIVYSIFYTAFTYFLLRDKVKPSLSLILQIVFLVFLGICILGLINTGHLGATIVHHFGVQSIM
ncbi:MAG: hypothetical protein A2X64_07195 [Ignavibacteria bacterium GWF2_33_9]|nr:MAG: hypothetical protein A2X64_07195 [Ignavibacteria bacterium GWF2_33_9]